MQAANETSDARIVALNAGRIAQSEDGSPSAVVKEPLGGTVPVTVEGIAGDEQADVRYHGGPDQALCVYASEYYEHWAARLGRQLPDACFGENLTVTGLLDADVCLGDVYQVGDALVQVSAPRTPCFKPGQRAGEPRLKQWMKDAAYNGFYLRVLEPGALSVGEPIVNVSRPHPGLTVELAYLARRRRDPALIYRTLAYRGLAARYRTDLLARLGA